MRPSIFRVVGSYTVAAIVSLVPSVLGVQEEPVRAVCKRLDNDGFRLVMQTVADGWNRGEASTAASCFAENALYSAPPSSPHRGRSGKSWFGVPGV